MHEAFIADGCINSESRMAASTKIKQWRWIFGLRVYSYVLTHLKYLAAITFANPIFRLYSNQIYVIFHNITVRNKVATCKHVAPTHSVFDKRALLVPAAPLILEQPSFTVATIAHLRQLERTHSLARGARFAQRNGSASIRAVLEQRSRF